MLSNHSYNTRNACTKRFLWGGMGELWNIYRLFHLCTGQVPHFVSYTIFFSYSNRLKWKPLRYFTLVVSRSKCSQPICHYVSAPNRMLFFKSFNFLWLHSFHYAIDPNQTRSCVGLWGISSALLRLGKK